ncbi:SulP family inorganic anion transporter [Lysinibacillus irui]|uniref:SulP family inorganic anion transporter n=1 Tax=Lysinibacillus irui TaxID=2998077 RepID=A0ABU5NSI5_9BACI|nr:SulP family inorganic anion transporter [Lysinibacillus irui]MEA0553220.1 SulP family inorganic anion transporter [Lysinibacillus irui]MEA0979020.1 SulP family inorganic anion transporter [Lysinibacillus irui]MEA1045174.1 SulP family inorganic anion transporter [Lysinibacillus irui]
MQTLKEQWFGNVRADLLSGIVVALALIPEAIAFSIIAGVDPMVGLYASFCIATIIAFVGGRPAMISAATGAMALVMTSLVKDHGLQYLLAATILTGIFQLFFGVLGIAKLMRFIPNAVMIGFVNALAILIFMAQVPHFLKEGLWTYVFIGITLLIVYIVPRFFKAIPAPLIAIVVLTIVAFSTGVELKTIGDLGSIERALPSFFIPNVPFTMETLIIILPYSLALSIVGLLESLLTSQIVDDMTSTKSDKNREARGQGIANIVNGFFGGMAGCAMIGQSVINVKSGGRGRLSTLVAGVFLMFLIIVLGDLVVDIPMPVLVGIMIMVSIGTFDWDSFRYIVTAPRADAFVMIATVLIVVYTDNLAIGVVIGVILSALFFVSKVSKVSIQQAGTTFIIEGPLFFASTKSFMQAFEHIKASSITIDLSSSHLWDESAVGALMKVKARLEAQQIDVNLVGLNPASQALYYQLNGITTNH